jgi:hypothetical protein
MKKIFQNISTVVAIILIIIFIGNFIIRVSDGENDIGIFEEIFLGRSVFSFLQPPWSENYKLWDEASKKSNLIADIINKHGSALVDNEELENIRLEALEISSSAYLDASSVDLEYLKKSNNELPEMFSTKLTNALKLWSEGLKEKDYNKIVEGTQFYNDFLQWIQSKERDYFNGLR